MVAFSSLSWLYLASMKMSAVRFHVQVAVPSRYFFASLVPTLVAEVEVMLTPSNEVSRERSEALMKWLALGLAVSLPKYSSVVVSWSGIAPRLLRRSVTVVEGRLAEP